MNADKKCINFFIDVSNNFLKIRFNVPSYLLFAVPLTRTSNIYTSNWNTLSFYLFRIQMKWNRENIDIWNYSRFKYTRVRVILRIYIYIYFSREREKQISYIVNEVMCKIDVNTNDMNNTNLCICERIKKKKVKNKMK